MRTKLNIREGDFRRIHCLSKAGHGAAGEAARQRTAYHQVIWLASVDAGPVGDRPSALRWGICITYSVVAEGVRAFQTSVGLKVARRIRNGINRGKRTPCISAIAIQKELLKRRVVRFVVWGGSIGKRPLAGADPVDF
jgi:hypothetical protein